MADESLERARILIIDDEPMNVRILERVLGQDGFTDLGLITDPREVAGQFESRPPDLLLLDLLMPHVTGFDILAWLRDRAEPALRPPVLVLTADATRDARNRALTSGATDFITKPFDHVEVLLRVRNLLTRRFLEVDLWAHNQDLEVRVANRTHQLQETADLLSETARQRAELARRLVTAQEEERRRVAADVHDGSVQSLVVLGMRMELLARRLHDPAERAEMERLRAMLAEALTGLRTLMFELRPPSLDEAGLEVALREHAARMHDNAGLAVAFDANLRGEPPPEARATLFRIAQEALANVHRHAAVSQAAVTLVTDGAGARISIRDAGRGYDAAVQPPPGHLGLRTMQERAEVAGGWCRVESAPGAGTTVTAWIPFTADEPAASG